MLIPTYKVISNSGSVYINEVIDPKFYTANVSTVFLSNKIFDTVNYLHIAKLVKYT